MNDVTFSASTAVRCSGASGDHSRRQIAQHHRHAGSYHVRDTVRRGWIVRVPALEFTRHLHLDGIDVRNRQSLNVTCIVGEIDGAPIRDVGHGERCDLFECPLVLE
jgi:hypothetical protein